MKQWFSWLGIACLLAYFSSLPACTSVPQPCDPQFVAAQQAAMAISCRTKAEQVCPGYSRMTEDEKLECPGVLECLEKIEKVETDCHGL